MKKSWSIAGKSGLIGVVGLISMNFISAAGKWSITSVLNSWAESGVFTYLLPFLLVFALVFAILQKSNLLGDNKGSIAIIAAALGLLSLVGDYFPNFLERFAPNVAMGVCVVLAAIILFGVFYSSDEKSWTKWIIVALVIVGIIAFIAIVSDTFSTGYGYSGYLWEDYGPALVTVLILAGIITAVVMGGKKKA